jgi:hypothetical protein
LLALKHLLVLLNFLLVLFNVLLDAVIRTAHGKNNHAKDEAKRGGCGGYVEWDFHAEWVCLTGA